MTVINSPGAGNRTQEVATATRPIASISNRPAEITEFQLQRRETSKETAGAVHARKYQLATEQWRKNPGNSTFETQRRNRNISRIKESRSPRGILARATGKKARDRDLGLSLVIREGFLADT